MDSRKRMAIIHLISTVCINLCGWTVYMMLGMIWGLLACCLTQQKDRLPRYWIPIEIIYKICFKREWEGRKTITHEIYAHSSHDLHSAGSLIRPFEAAVGMNIPIIGDWKEGGRQQMVGGWREIAASPKRVGKRGGREKSMASHRTATQRMPCHFLT